MLLHFSVNKKVSIDSHLTLKFSSTRQEVGTVSRIFGDDKLDHVAGTKFAYLESVLRSTSLTVISGIPVIHDNHAVAIKLLRERFGKKEAIVEFLYSRLQSLPRNKYCESFQWRLSLSLRRLKSHLLWRNWKNITVLCVSA